MGASDHELRIYWDGDAPGLREHRLSIGAFGPPLSLLLAALRRIAASKLEGFEFRAAKTTGGLPAIAQMIDLEVAALAGGSINVSAMCTFRPPPGGSYPLFLMQQSTDELLTALEEESKGISRQPAVRKFVASVPAGVTRQRYSILRDGREVRTVEFGKAFLPDMVRLPRFRRIEGDIVGLGFEPGRPEVRIRVDARTTLVCPATADQVSKALQLRLAQEKVVAMVVASDRRVERLLWIRPVSESTARLPQKQVDDYLCRRWDKTLEELAK